MKLIFKQFFSLLLLVWLAGCAQTAIKTGERKTASTSGAALILDYSSGFQAGWTWIKIYTDGTIEQQERVCCPPVTNPATENKLSSDKIESLMRMIQDASKGELVVKHNKTLGLGQKIGTLTVYNSSGQAITIENVDRNAPNRGDIELRDSSATKEMIDFLRPYAKNIILE